MAGVLDQLLAHARLPEALEVLRSRMNGRFVVRIGAKETADVVGHFDKVMNIHRFNPMISPTPTATYPILVWLEWSHSDFYCVSILRILAEHSSRKRKIWTT